MSERGDAHEERLDHVHEVVGGNDFLVEENQAAQEVVVHFLVAERLAHLHRTNTIVQT